MKITQSQKEEIEFMENWAKPAFQSTNEEQEEYIQSSVHGKKIPYEKNRLLSSKRSFEITSAMWREDLSKGMLGIWELDEDFNHLSHWKRLRKGLVNSLRPDFTLAVESLKSDSEISRETGKGMLGNILINTC